MTNVMMVTGGSRGIGAATALLAAERGYAVCVNYLSSRDHAEKIVDEIKSNGGKALAVHANVAEEADVVRLFRTCIQELGGVDVLVNNAGILEKQMRLEDMHADRIDRVFATNVRGAFICAREAVRHMSTKHGGKGGAIVNISSKAAILGSPNEYIDYAASKGAIETLTTGLAKEVATEGIRVNAVRPGLIETDIHALSGDPDRPDKLRATIPMQRSGEVDEVAQAIVWLASDEASYSTGAFIDVTGGR